MKQERSHRRAFRIADGISANGHTAFSLYGLMNDNTMIHFDNRGGEDLLATNNELEARLRRRLSGAPLRLLHSGRQERQKGSQDLIPSARRLNAKDVDFTLDIFGTGSFEDEIRKGVAERGLQDMVKLNGAVDFESELVPFARKHADVYPSFCWQSDPSCTYIENAGCSLAVIGYANRMWSTLLRRSSAGLVATSSYAQALIETVVDAASNRPRVTECCMSARDFARRHSFEHEFSRLIAHLRTLT